MEKRQTLWKPSRVFALECWLPQDRLPWWIPWIKLLSIIKLLKAVFKAVVQIKCPMYLKVQVTIAISVQCPTHKMTKLHLDQNQKYRSFFCDKRMITLEIHGDCDDHDGHLNTWSQKWTVESPGGKNSANWLRNWLLNNFEMYFYVLNMPPLG